MTQSRETIEFDVCIIGAGPAGLAAAIELKQLDPDIAVCILEKGASVGAHILSGAVIEPRALNELLPDWRLRGAPIHVEAKEDHFYYLNNTRAFKLPTPPQMKNHGNYIVSLSNVCKWLATEAEALGVQIFPGFPAAEIIIEDGSVKGVITGEFGRSKEGHETSSYQPGIEIRSSYTLFAEGCRGSLSEQLIAQFNLRENADCQTYAIGIKEIWEIDPAKHSLGTIIHTVGWPLDSQTYGGSFAYHVEDNKLLIGLITALDYKNPWLDPFQEFQRMKLNPLFSNLLKGGRRIQYGAKALNEGGLQSLPALTFPGGALIGCSAGFLNVPKIKGSHLAMKSGMLAAESIVEARKQNNPALFETLYPEKFRHSWAHEELHEARNIRPAFRFGLWAGLLNAAIDTYIFKGKAPWTLSKRIPDHAQLHEASTTERINYPKPDNQLTFDRLSSVYLSNTNHVEDQPVHLRLKDASVPVEYNLPKYAAPEQRYCPAGVYEIIENNGKPHLQINAQNCVHCKTCDIKDPTQNIVWTTPEGTGGPNYEGM